MYELAWIALGLLIALFATRLAKATKRATEPPPPDDEPVAPGAKTRLVDDCVVEPDAEGTAPKSTETEGTEPKAPEPPPEQPRSLDATITPESHEMAMSLATELASLVSAVEGRAHHLIEAAPSPASLPPAAESMLTAIARLRTLHTKLLAFGRGRPQSTGTTDIKEMIAGLTDELQQMQLGLELRWEPPSELPHINACPAAVRDAMLFVCAALLRVERGATRLTFRAERSFTSEPPSIQIEIDLEWNSAAARPSDELLCEPSFALDLEAAKQLVRSHDGDVTLSQLPGKSIRAVVRIPMALAAPTRAESMPAAPTGSADTAQQHPSEQELAPVDANAQPTASGKNTPHHFGGALVLESDPTLRAVVAGELKASGRAVFACADGASAHTFLQATPDRFELLIVDDAQQLAEHTPLARTIREHAPDLKICLLTPGEQSTPELWPQAHCLQKPFGVHDLRRTLASLLSTG